MSVATPRKRHRFPCNRWLKEGALVTDGAAFARITSIDADGIRVADEMSACVWHWCSVFRSRGGDPALVRAWRPVAAS